MESAPKSPWYAGKNKIHICNPRDEWNRQSSNEKPDVDMLKVGRSSNEKPYVDMLKVGPVTSKRLAVVNCLFHRLFLLSMAAVGLYYPKNFSNCGGGGKWRWPITVYATMVLLLVASNALRIFVTLPYQVDQLDLEFFTRVATVTFVTMSSVSFVIHYAISFSKKRGIAKYYESINEVVDKFAALGMSVSWKDNRGWEIALLAVSIALWAGVLAAFVPSLVDSSSLAQMEWMLRMRIGNSTTISELKIVSYVTAVTFAYQSAATIFSVTYVLSVVKQLTFLFGVFNRKLEMLASSEPGTFFSNIGMYRLAYRDMRLLVNHVDGYFRFTYGMHFAATLAVSMMQLYILFTDQALKDPGKISTAGGVILWFAMSLAIFTAEFTSSCLLGSKAKECTEHLQLVSSNAGCSSNEQLTQLQLFLSLAAEDTGFTVFSLMLVSTDALFPIMGTWITYFLIIVQFGSPSAASSSST